MKLKSIWPALAGVLSLVGCGGGGGGSSPPPPPVTVSGVVTFDLVPHDLGASSLDYGSTFQSPARGVAVEAIDAGSGVTILASSSTDETGAYSLDVAPDTQMFIRVKAQMATGGSPAWNFRVIDNTNGGALYVLDGANFNSGSGTTRNLNAGSGWGGAFYDGVRAAGPFAILDAVYAAFNKVLDADPGAVFPGLDINWSVNNVPVSGEIEDGEIGTSFYNGVAIFLLGREDNDTDEYDDHVIIHEWGHYFEAQFARSDSIGGSHGGGDYLDMRLAFGEGWGNAFSGMATDDPFYRDSFGSQQEFGFDIDVESNNGAATNNGWFSESSVQSILYDVYDSADDGVDSVSLGFAPIFQILTGEQRDTPALTSIFPFITALKAANPAEAANIDAVVQGQDIVSVTIDAFGSGETNSAGEAQDVLPIYTPITVGGGSMQVCSMGGVTADPGTFNKLSISRFLRFSVNAQGDYTFTATGVAGDDPDMILRDRGAGLVVSKDTNPDGSETFTQSLAPGEYVLEVYEFGNLLPPAVGRACFDITIN